MPPKRKLLDQGNNSAPIKKPKNRKNATDIPVPAKLDCIPGEKVPRKSIGSLFKTHANVNPHPVYMYTEQLTTGQTIYLRPNIFQHLAQTIRSENSVFFTGLYPWECVNLYKEHTKTVEYWMQHPVGQRFIRQRGSIEDQIETLNGYVHLDPKELYADFVHNNMVFERKTLNHVLHILPEQLSSDTFPDEEDGYEYTDPAEMIEEAAQFIDDYYENQRITLRSCVEEVDYSSSSSSSSSTSTNNVSPQELFQSVRSDMVTQVQQLLEQYYATWKEQWEGLQLDMACQILVYRQDQRLWTYIRNFLDAIWRYLDRAETNHPQWCEEQKRRMLHLLLSENGSLQFTWDDLRMQHTSEFYTYYTRHALNNPFYTGEILRTIYEIVSADPDVYDRNETLERMIRYACLIYRNQPKVCTIWHPGFIGNMRVEMYGHADALSVQRYRDLIRRIISKGNITSQNKTVPHLNQPLDSLADDLDTIMSNISLSSPSSSASSASFDKFYSGNQLIRLRHLPFSDVPVSSNPVTVQYPLILLLYTNAKETDICPYKCARVEWTILLHRMDDHCFSIRKKDKTKSKPSKSKSKSKSKKTSKKESKEDDENNDDDEEEEDDEETEEEDDEKGGDSKKRESTGREYKLASYGGTLKSRADLFSVLGVSVYQPKDSRYAVSQEFIEKIYRYFKVLDYCILDRTGLENFLQHTPGSLTTTTNARKMYIHPWYHPDVYMKLGYQPPEFNPGTILNFQKGDDGKLQNPVPSRPMQKRLIPLLTLLSSKINVRFENGYSVGYRNALVWLTQRTYDQVLSQHATSSSPKKKERNDDNPFTAAFQKLQSLKSSTFMDLEGFGYIFPPYWNNKMLQTERDRLRKRLPYDAPVAKKPSQKKSAPSATDIPIPRIDSLQTFSFPSEHPAVLQHATHPSNPTQQTVHLSPQPLQEIPMNSPRPRSRTQSPEPIADPLNLPIVKPQDQSQSTSQLSAPRPLPRPLPSVQPQPPEPNQQSSDLAQPSRPRPPARVPSESPGTDQHALPILGLSHDYTQSTSSRPRPRPLPIVQQRSPEPNQQSSDLAQLSRPRPRARVPSESPETDQHPLPAVELPTDHLQSSTQPSRPRPRPRPIPRAQPESSK